MKTKNLITISLILLWFFILLVQPLHAKLYKWKDENGKTHFTDDSSKIPFKYRKNIKEKYKNNQTSTNCNKQLDSKAEKKINKIKARIQKSKDKIKKYQIGIRDYNSEYNKKTQERELRYKKHQDKQRLDELKRRVDNKNRKNIMKGTKYEREAEKRMDESYKRSHEFYEGLNKRARNMVNSTKGSLKRGTNLYKERIQREEKEIKENKNRLKLICEKYQ